MNKKILFLSVGLFCLPLVHALELPETIHNIGKEVVNIWLWELDPSVDDRDDIENNILESIGSIGQSSTIIKNSALESIQNVGNSSIISVHWLDSSFKNYQHFDDVIHKIDNADDQLSQFYNYLKKNYGQSRNNYHVLMTESNWGSWFSSKSGEAYSSYYYSISSDNYESSAAHMVGLMLGAKSNSSTYWFSASIMYPNPGFYSRENKFWDNDNKNRVWATLSSILTSAVEISLDALYSGNTSSAPKYIGLHRGVARRASIYKLSIPQGQDRLYSIEIESANFDTYLYVYDKAGNVLASNDDSNKLMSKILYTPPTSPSEIYIVVSGFSESNGEFSLRVKKEQRGVIR
ncbi:hypothetical protein [Bathymodiolus thermophilus thioautotrophic gill symbiont]|uniref:Uncharacterized protein n=1 Tax=Bathymodiolus thermophilus thioautotrophic gill symbiont TaxID=2360 RepID=A0A8H8XBV4_9GAMM|nr:hypothetical protein [Bathymodiolus thermophilus thioautotrophic gill symbiont]CAB5494317.1 hypothetical protein THERMOS_78 [Bathymodiolus thermophilus thioautotrophic gill symbiont]